MDSDEEISLESELEVLKSTYIHELEFGIENGRTISLSVNLEPATGDVQEAKFVRLTLVLYIPADYPHSLPITSVKNPRGLDEDTVNKILSDCERKASQLIGNPMLFEIIEVAKEILTFGNRPTCQCAICLYGFTPDDIFIKTDCYHYFHTYCLSSFVAHSKNEHIEKLADEERSKVNMDNATPFQAECPVCRLPINFAIDDAHIYPPPKESLNDQDEEIEISNEMKREQRRMAAIYQYQKAKGGIIDLDLEKSRFEIAISSAPDISTTSLLNSLSEKPQSPSLSKKSVETSPSHQNHYPKFKKNIPKQAHETPEQRNANAGRVNTHRNSSTQLKGSGNNRPTLKPNPEEMQKTPNKALELDATQNDLQAISEGQNTSVSISEIIKSSEEIPETQNITDAIPESQSNSDAIPDGQISSDAIPDGQISSDVIPDGRNEPDTISEGQKSSDVIPEGQISSDVIPENQNDPDTISGGQKNSDAIPEDQNKSSNGQNAPKASETVQNAPKSFFEEQRGSKSFYKVPYITKNSVFLDKEAQKKKKQYERNKRNRERKKIVAMELRAASLSNTNEKGTHVKRPKEESREPAAAALVLSEEMMHLNLLGMERKVGPKEMGQNGSTATAENAKYHQKPRRSSTFVQTDYKRDHVNYKQKNNDYNAAASKQDENDTPNETPRGYANSGPPRRYNNRKNGKKWPNKDETVVDTFCQTQNLESVGAIQTENVDSKPQIESRYKKFDVRNQGKTSNDYNYDQSDNNYRGYNNSGYNQSYNRYKRDNYSEPPQRYNNNRNTASNRTKFTPPKQKPDFEQQKTFESEKSGFETVERRDSRDNNMDRRPNRRASGSYHEDYSNPIAYKQRPRNYRGSAYSQNSAQNSIPTNDPPIPTNNPNANDQKETDISVKKTSNRASYRSNYSNRNPVQDAKGSQPNTPGAKVSPHQVRQAQMLFHPPGIPVSKFPPSTVNVSLKDE